MVVREPTMYGTQSAADVELLQKSRKQTTSSSEEESKQLEHFLEMNDLKDKSKWIASYLIAKELGLNDGEQLDFLIFAFW